MIFDIFKKKKVLTNKELQEKIEDLEKKLFKKEDTNLVFSHYIDWAYGFGGEAYKPLTLEEKIDAIAKYLKVNLEREVKDEVVAKVIKTKKKK